MATKANTNLYPNETYMITLPLTEEKQDDVPVSINGKTWLIKRGEEVEVPGMVYEVLMNSQKMDQLAVKRQREAAANTH